MSHYAHVLDLLSAAYPEVTFELQGDGCHFHITAVGAIFSGLKKIQRQKMLNQILSPLLADGTIHAVQYTILAPEEVKQ